MRTGRAHAHQVQAAIPSRSSSCNASANSWSTTSAPAISEIYNHVVTAFEQASGDKLELAKRIYPHIRLYRVRAGVQRQVQQCRRGTAVATRRGSEPAGPPCWKTGLSRKTAWSRRCRWWNPSAISGSDIQYRSQFNIPMRQLHYTLNMNDEHCARTQTGDDHGRAPPLHTHFYLTAARLTQGELQWRTQLVDVSCRALLLRPEDWVASDDKEYEICFVLGQRHRDQDAGRADPRGQQEAGLRATTSTSTAPPTSSG